jgi:hypothetical protein
MATKKPSKKELNEYAEDRFVKIVGPVDKHKYAHSLLLGDIEDLKTKAAIDKYLGKVSLSEYANDLMWEYFGERDDFLDDWKAVEVFLEEEGISREEVKNMCDFLLEDYVNNYDKSYMNMPKAWNGKKPKK